MPWPRLYWSKAKTVRPEGPPEATLLIYVVAFAGVLTILAVIGALGGWQTVALTDTASAQAALAEEIPDFPVSEVTLAVDGGGALFWDEAGRRAAAIFAFGDRWVARELKASDIAGRVAKPRAVKFDFRTSDFTCPRFALSIPEGKEDIWTQRIAATPPQTGQRIA